MINFNTLYQKTTKKLTGFGLGRFGVFKKIHSFLKIKLRPKFVMVNGYKLFLNRKDFYVCSHLLNFGTWEFDETELVKKEIKKGDTVVDLGAHIGYYTLLFSKLVGDSGVVFAFEPDRENFDILSKNVKENNCFNVKLVNMGVLDKSGKALLYPRIDSNKGGHRMYPTDNAIFGNPVEVDAISLDDYFKNYNGNINFIKIDIEGSEKTALNGMMGVLNKNKNIKILTESGTKEYMELLKILGFEFYNTKKRERIVSSINEMSDTNILCIKG